MKQKLLLFFRNLTERWKRVGHKIGDFQARLILTLFYFIIVGPFALVIRFGGDPLRIKPGTMRGWVKPTTHEEPVLERALRQF